MGSKKKAKVAGKPRYFVDHSNWYWVMDRERKGPLAMCSLPNQAAHIVRALNAYKIKLPCRGQADRGGQ